MPTKRRTHRRARRTSRSAPDGIRSTSGETARHAPEPSVYPDTFPFLYIYDEMRERVEKVWADFPNELFENDLFLLRGALEVWESAEKEKWAKDNAAKGFSFTLTPSQELVLFGSRLEKLVEQVYAKACEVWELRNTKSPEFLIGVFFKLILPIAKEEQRRFQALLRTSKKVLLSWQTTESALELEMVNCDLNETVGNITDRWFARIQGEAKRLELSCYSKAASVPEYPMEFADQDQVPGGMVVDIRPFSEVAKELAEKAARRLRDALQKAQENFDNWLANPRMPPEKRRKLFREELSRDLPSLIRRCETEFMTWFHPRISGAENKLASKLFREAVKPDIEEFCRSHDLAFPVLLELNMPPIEEMRRIRMGLPPGRLPASRKGEGSSAPSRAFAHSKDYRSVSRDGKLFQLTPGQALVIQDLHEHYQRGTPDVGNEYLLERLGTHGSNSRLRDVFKSNMEAWQTLIDSKRRGTVRLNLPDPQSPVS